jgi:L-methionine (R)-S-oxide reductase
MMTLYEQLERQVRELLANETDLVANAANFAALVYHELPDVNWAGFYFPTPAGDLLLGPFCGLPACMRIPAGRGVCGIAAVRQTTLVVDDVSRFSDHIVCDTASRSEIAVPFFTDETFRGIFDCDSPRLARFTDADRAGIERLVEAFSASLRAPERLER